MGLFDTVHTGTRCGQTKALGRSLADLAPGDRCWVVPAPVTAAQEAELRAGRLGSHPETSFQVAMWQGGFLRVVDTILTDWVTDPDPDLPCFDSLGHPMGAPVDAGPPADSPTLELLRRRAAGEGEETDQDRLFNDFFGLPHEDQLPPAERAARRAERVQAGRRDLDDALGLPGDCPLCAAIRAGDLAQLRATRAAEDATRHAELNALDPTSRQRASRERPERPRRAGVRPDENPGTTDL